MGFEPLSAIDTTQLIHFTTRQKRQNGQIWGIEVHGRYTTLRFAIGPLPRDAAPVLPRGVSMNHSQRDAHSEAQPGRLYIP